MNTTLSSQLVKINQLIKENSILLYNRKYYQPRIRRTIWESNVSIMGYEFFLFSLLFDLQLIRHPLLMCITPQDTQMISQPPIPNLPPPFLKLNFKTDRSTPPTFFRGILPNLVCVSSDKRNQKLPLCLLENERKPPNCRPVELLIKVNKDLPI